MMSRWYCLNCDNCGDPGPMAETPNQARQEARALGWKRELRQPQPPALSARYEDICPKHSREEPNQ